MRLFRDSEGSQLAWPGVIAALLALLAACGGGQGADIDDILVSPPTVVDIGAQSASLVAVTKAKTVCAVAYGPTTEYGRLAAHSSMGADGHTDHDHYLDGLQPDTVYHYRWGLIGPGGIVYRSEDRTFRTAAAGPGASQQQGGDNLALLSKGTRVVGSSSIFGGGDNDSTWGANHAIDGDPRTQWSSDGDGDDAWIEIEMPSMTHIMSLGFWTRTMGASAQIMSFRVVTESGEVEGPFTLDSAAAVQRFDMNLNAKRLRFEVVESSGGNTGAVEVEVYGDPVP